MAVLVFVLSLVLLAAGLASGYLSLDLIPTGPGLVYAFAGVVSAVGAIVVFALGLVIVHLGDLTRAVREQALSIASLAAAAPALAEAVAQPSLLDPDEAEPLELQGNDEEVEGPVEREPEPEAEPRQALTDPTEEAEPEPPVDDAEGEMTEEVEGGARETEAPLNENRAGHLPTLEEIERAIEKTEAPPTLIGRYSSGGANYMIFSDGTIEADTDEGAYKFTSMGDFRKFLLDHNTGKL